MGKESYTAGGKRVRHIQSVGRGPVTYRGLVTYSGWEEGSSHTLGRKRVRHIQRVERESHTEGRKGVTYRGWEESHILRVGKQSHTAGGKGVTYSGWEEGPSHTEGGKRACHIQRVGRGPVTYRGWEEGPSHTEGGKAVTYSG